MPVHMHCPNFMSKDRTENRTAMQYPATFIAVLTGLYRNMFKFWAQLFKANEVISKQDSHIQIFSSQKHC